MRFGTAFEVPELATPSRNPASGSYLVYFKSDGQLYRKTAGGAEALVVTTGSGGVPATRAINTTNGLQGGGDLSADRTLSPVYGTTAGTVAQGNDSRFSPPTHHAARNAASQNLATGSETNIVWANSTAADGITYNATGGVFTVPTTGKYSVSAGIAFAANTTGNRSLRLAINGTVIRNVNVFPVSGAVTSASLSDTFKLVAGDTVQVRALQTSGGTLAVGGVDSQSWVTVSYAGPTA